jgi:two-component system, OmpR family, alkaline phosphatase synthesis response regulator PhoP
MGRTVLIVEDDPDTVDVVRLYLRRDGHKVLTARDGKEGLRLAQESRPDLLVLDLMLPGLDGMEICRSLREEGSDVPVIMLTARVEEEDRLTGLDLGADDYITKPFSARELAARVRAVLRRTPPERLHMGPATLSFEDIKIDLSKRAVYVKGSQIHLTPIEFQLLVLFVRHPGRTFTRDEIIGRVLGHDFDGFDRTVDLHVFNLRNKIEANPRKPRYIKTIYRIGYRLGDA